MRSLAMDGRWVLYGVMGGKAVDGDLLGKLLFKRGHILSSLLRSRSLQVRLRGEKKTSTMNLTYFMFVDFFAMNTEFSSFYSIKLN